MLDLLERERREKCSRMHQEFMSQFKEGFFDQVNLSISDPVHMMAFRVNSVWLLKKLKSKKNKKVLILVI